MIKARIDHIFSSVQGEGVYVGYPMIFIRFYGCNLKCVYCDTFQNRYEELSVEEVYRKVKDLQFETMKFVSLTGGEPLIQAEFISELLPVLKKGGFKTHLETNASLPENLEKIKGPIDIISADIKLPSSCLAGIWWKEHARFLDIALSRKTEVFVKAVITWDTTLEDIVKAVVLIRETGKNIPFVLQPDTSQIGREMAEKIQHYQKICMLRLRDVRVIPQIHKFMNLR